jgi:concentrative nucleoside transporter, CNT family
MSRFIGLLGLVVLLGLAFLFSTDRRAIRYKTVAWGIGLQFVLGLFVFRFGVGQYIFKQAGLGVTRLLDCTYAGSTFVFGAIGGRPGEEMFVNTTTGKPDLLFTFAFGVLPMIIFISAFFALLYHYGIMQIVIKGMARFMTWVMGVSGAESMDVAASIFMGQTEAPLSIRPFLPELTRSELMTVMTAGMAHVSGSVMGAYIAFGAKPENLLTAVIMTAPGTILMAKMLVPETGTPLTATRPIGDTKGQVVADAVSFDTLDSEHKSENFLAAIAKGTGDGLQLALNVAAMLISFLALIALVNLLLGGFSGFLARHGAAWFPSDLQTIFGWALSPIAWLIGIPWHDATRVGGLLGTRMVLNELIAFKDLGAMKDALDPRSFTIATFALCGFANLSSIGIQIGGIGALAPNRKGELAQLGFRAMLAGTMANLISASIVGILYTAK